MQKKNRLGFEIETPCPFPKKVSFTKLAPLYSSLQSDNDKTWSYLPTPQLGEDMTHGEFF